MKFEDNLSPYTSYAESSAPSSPSAGNQRVYIDSADHLLKRKNSAGAITILDAGAAATSYVPALTAASVNPTLGSGSAVAGHYIQTGKLVTVWGSIAFGSSGTNAGSGEYYISFPITAISTSPRVFGGVMMFDSSAGLFFAGAGYYSSTTVFRIAQQNASAATVQHNNPFAWAASDVIIFQLVYEAA